MKLVTFIYKDKEQPGVLSPEGTHVIPLEGWATLEAFITDCAGESPASRLPDAAGIPLSEVRLTAPIPNPRHDILCIGQNYLAHAIESCQFKGIEYVKPRHPMYFGKRVNRAVASGEPVPSHSDITKQLDYEVELAVIIGKRCDHAKPEDVFDYIFGYTIVNDISARDIQNAHVQYTFGKSLDGFAPMGPWIVTIDEFQSPPDLRISTKINGDLRQDSRTSDFIFDIPHIISELSSGIVLEPGDIIITGTPSGVGMGLKPPCFLLPGDVIECEIEGIGKLINTVE